MRKKDKLETLLDEYYDVFDENYPLVITDTRSTEEICEDVQKCIDSGKRKKSPKLKKGLDY